MEEKKELEVDHERIKQKKQKERMRVEEDLEKEKKQIIENYAYLLKEMKTEELFIKERELIEYRTEIEEKLTDEKEV